MHKGQRKMKPTDIYPSMHKGQRNMNSASMWSRWGSEIFSVFESWRTVFYVCRFMFYMYVHDTWFADSCFICMCIIHDCDFDWLDYRKRILW